MLENNKIREGSTSFRQRFSEWAGMKMLTRILHRILRFIQRKTSLAIFLFSFAVIFGPAFALFDSYDYDITANPDIGTYLKLADFDFDQSPVRRYRVIVPFLASGINYVFAPLFSVIEPMSFPGPDFSLCFSFLIVNCTLMAIFGAIVYALCKKSGSSSLGAIIGVLSVLTCRWTSYIAGLPIVDSLYMVVAGMTLLGLQTNNKTFILLSIFLGPWAKESFLFIAPLIVLYAPQKKLKLIGWFLISGLIIFSFRYLFDFVNNLQVTESLQNDFAHFNLISMSLKRLFSFHGIYELFSITGFWGFMFLLLINKKIRDGLRTKTPHFTILYLAIVFFHALLSTDLARMFYLATPVLAVWLSILFDGARNTSFEIGRKETV